MMNGGRGVGWGHMKGEAVLLGRRHPCARSSSVCVLVVCVHAHCPCARSSPVCALVVRVHARRPCARSSSVCSLVVRVRARCPVHGRSLCVGGASSLSKGGASSSGGGGRRLWALGGLSIRGPWSSLVGVGRCSWALCRCRGRWVVVRGHWVADWRWWGSFPWAGCSCVLVCRSWAWW